MSMMKQNLRSTCKIIKRNFLLRLRSILGSSPCHAIDYKPFTNDRVLVTQIQDQYR